MKEQTPEFLVSACLCGLPCRYDGKSKPVEDVRRLWEEGRALPFCPEQAGGLKIPREPSEIQNGDGADVLSGRAKVLSRSGEDVTEHYLKGARLALQACKKMGICKAVLKSKSPSCGCYTIHDGSFTDAMRPGMGVTAALLAKEGIRVCSEEDDYEG